MKLTVIGTGYLGATHAACMAELGHEVLGVDVDPVKIDQLSSGETPFFEPELDELLQRNLAAGNLSFTTDYKVAADFAQVHFIGVGTPQKAGSGAADTQYVDAVIDSLVPHLHGQHVFFGKSTVPVGTARRLAQRAKRLIEAHPDQSAEVIVAWNPEFLREGHAVDDTLRPDRIVLGVEDSHAELATSLAEKVYAKPLAAGCPFLVMDRQTAELVKISANAFLATKISFINAVSEVCEAADADVTQIAHAIGLDDWIGPKFLGAGLGFGGGCLPKDIRAFVARANELGVGKSLRFLEEIDRINTRRREKVIQLALQLADDKPEHTTVTVLGAAFKPNSDDVRDSPALDVAAMLHTRGFTTNVYDPVAVENAAKVYPRLSYKLNLSDALDGCDLVIIGTEWEEFRQMDPVWAKAKVRTASPTIIDARNCLPRQQWIDAGWRIVSLGRSVEERQQ
ncbi:UDP-glucose dehydrogenase family protein [Corynebacterium choanae]|uniref:UDP-glucose 6-dehydrogenase n=1 Tax=Corynebacterium choanae TaxID=1862358 RepID=A0A3G6J632_9CORY|nr:UDP-glucose/GDP-mannose dehydrogenase family protein [Corynebacterium choanae]AZA13233.1 UDP-glucose 6-dehydrogenase TuaD [Corynebacterium choanae]